MKQVRKDKALAAIVRTFFRYFVTGIIEAQDELTAEERFEPRNIKRIMLEHYEQVSLYFNKEAFYSLFRLNYEEDEMERELRAFMTKDTTYMELVRLACRTENFYSMMVEEYKRNFELLLCGRLETADEHEQAYTRCPEAGTISFDKAEMIISSIAANAYAHGKTVAEKHDEAKS